MFNGFALNAGAVNSNGIQAQIVLLPSATTGLSFAVSERESVFLSGTTSIDQDVAGDLARLAIIGAGSAGITLEVTGDLTVYRVAEIGEALTGIDLDATGALTRRIQIPAGATEITLDATGDLLLTGILAGSTSIDQDATGEMTRIAALSGDTGIDQATTALLTRIRLLAGDTGIAFTTYADLMVGQVRELGEAATSISLDTTGALTSVTRLAGSTGMALDVVGSLSSVQYLAGDTGLTLNLTGALSVNATGRDIDENTMARPPNPSRDMVRTPA